MEHVITIRPSGKVEALHNDRMPLSFLGDMEVRRASELVFDSSAQTWRVEVMDKDGKRYLCSHNHYTQGFGSYEEARQYEIRWLTNCLMFDVIPWSPKGLNEYASASREAHNEQYSKSGCHT